EINSYGNIFSGTITTSATSRIRVNSTSNYSSAQFNNTVQNSGNIDLESSNCYYAQIIMAVGATLGNQATGIITSKPNANCFGYNVLDGALNNIGTLNINYPLRHTTT